MAKVIPDPTKFTSDCYQITNYDPQYWQYNASTKNFGCIKYKGQDFIPYWSRCQLFPKAFMFETTCKNETTCPIASLCKFKSDEFGNVFYLYKNKEDVSGEMWVKTKEFIEPSNYFFDSLIQNLNCIGIDLDVTDIVDFCTFRGDWMVLETTDYLIVFSYETRDDQIYTEVANITIITNHLDYQISNTRLLILRDDFTITSF